MTTGGRPLAGGRPGQLLRGDSMSQQRTGTRFGFNYVTDFLAVAQGGQQSQAIRIDASTDFAVMALHFAAQYTAGTSFVSRSNIVGIDATPTTPNFTNVSLATKAKLYRNGEPNVAAVSGGALGHLKLQFTINDQPWQSAPMRADLITGEPGQIFILPVPPILQANSVLQVLLINDLPANVGGVASPAIDAQLILVGQKMLRGQN
jgi:hypothetical protein